MATKFKVLTLAGALALGTSGVALAQCLPGYALYGGVCQPVQPPGYSNPVSGAVSGEAAGAASGERAAGPVGAVVGGAIGTATGAVSGTANMLTGSPPACAAGYQYYNGGCYPVR